MKTGLEKRGFMTMPHCVPGGVGKTIWDAWISTSSPVANIQAIMAWSKDDVQNLRRPNTRYAKWLGDSPAGKEKGVYLWLLPRPSGNGMRLVHVGIAADRDSSLSARTKAHVYNLFRGSDRGSGQPCTFDRIFGLPGGGMEFGSLGSPLWDGDWPTDSRDAVAESEVAARIEAACNFIGAARIAFLVPKDQGDPLLIRNMEALIARSAALLYEGTICDGRGQKPSQITNDLTSGMAKLDVNGCASDLAKLLNEIEPMLPENAPR